MKDIINEFAVLNNIIAGVCSGERLCMGELRRQNDNTCELCLQRDCNGELRKKKYCTGDCVLAQKLLDAPFVTRSIERRLDPARSLNGVKSIIVIGVGHEAVCSRRCDNLPRGRISRQAANCEAADYHVIVVDMLEKLAKTILKSGNGKFNYKIMVDNNPLPERVLAVKAGIGYIGKNKAVISTRFGTFFSIGVMLTDLLLEPDKPSAGCCPDDCSACEEACPGGALNNGEYDYRRCVSYLTQKKGELTAAEIKTIGNWIYGCDVCQDVCPENNRPEITGKSIKNNSDCEIICPNLNSVINMDAAEFDKKYKNSSLYWRGRETIVRNAQYAKQNITQNNGELLWDIGVREDCAATHSKS